MKKVSLLVPFAFLVFTLAIAAQSSSNPSSSSNSHSPTPAPDASLQRDSSAGQAPTSDMNGNIMEGCVVQVEKDFYLEPVNGGNRLRLRGSHNFGADVGHRVRVEGTVGAPGTSLGGNPDNSQASSADRPSDSKASGRASSESSQTSSNANSNTQDFLTTRVTTISENCPSNAGSSGGSVTNPH